MATDLSFFVLAALQKPRICSACPSVFAPSQNKKILRLSPKRGFERGLVTIGLFVSGCSASSTDLAQESSSSKLQQLVSSSEVVTIGMPYDGRWADNGTHPKNHPQYFGGHWALDLHISEEYLHTKDNTSIPVVFTAMLPGSMEGTQVWGEVIAIDVTCYKPRSENGGRSVKLNVLTRAVPDGEPVVQGSVSYGHLENMNLQLGDRIETGTVLGNTRFWKRASCYSVSKGENVHAHFESTGCYSDLGASGTPAAMGTPIAALHPSIKKWRVSCSEALDTGNQYTKVCPDPACMQLP